MTMKANGRMEGTSIITTGIAVRWGQRACRAEAPEARRRMKRIGMGLVGAGFVGPHHIDAVRRLGYVDVVAVAGSNDASGAAKAEALGARRGYGSYQALIDDPEVQVVHNATPNHLHYEVTSAALKQGKHVVSDKPLAMTAAESK